MKNLRHQRRYIHSDLDTYEEGISSFHSRKLHQTPNLGNDQKAALVNFRGETVVLRPLHQN